MMNNFERMNERRENARIMGEFRRGLAVVAVVAVLAILIVCAMNGQWGV